MFSIYIHIFPWFFFLTFFVVLFVPHGINHEKFYDIERGKGREGGRLEGRERERESKMQEATPTATEHIYLVSWLAYSVFSSQLNDAYNFKLQKAVNLIFLSLFAFIMAEVCSCSY